MINLQAFAGGALLLTIVVGMLMLANALAVALTIRVPSALRQKERRRRVPTPQITHFAAIPLTVAFVLIALAPLVWIVYGRSRQFVSAAWWAATISITVLLSVMLASMILIDKLRAGSIREGRFRFDELERVHGLTAGRDRIDLVRAAVGVSNVDFFELVWHLGLTAVYLCLVAGNLTSLGAADHFYETGYSVILGAPAAHLTISALSRLRHSDARALHSIVGPSTTSSPGAAGSPSSSSQPEW